MSSPSPRHLLRRWSASQQPAGGKYWLRSASVVAALFGLLTIREGGNVLFLGGTEGCAAGQFVPFVVWFNFLAGFAYVAAAPGLWLRWSWAPGLALSIAGTTLIVFAAFVAHVALGGGYEVRTVFAMLLRIAVWTAITFLAYRFVGAERIRSQ